MRRELDNARSPLVNLECSKYNLELSAGPDIMRFLIDSVGIYTLFFAIFGLSLHIYILFCYFYKRKGDAFTSDHCLIMGISISNCISCFSLFILKFNEVSISKNERAHFIIDKIFNHVVADSMHFITLILALFRFYRFCRPVKSFLRVFSQQKILLYFATFYLLASAYVSIDYCYCYQVLSEQLSFIFQICVISMRRFFKGLCLVSALYFYLRVTKKLKEEIIEEKQILISAYSEILESEESSVEFSLDTFLKNPYHLREEKQYFETVKLFVLVFMPVLTLRYVVEIIINFWAFLSGKPTLNLYEQLTLRTLFAIQNTLYIMSSLHFYRTTEDFKKRFRQPFRSWFRQKNDEQIPTP